MKRALAGEAVDAILILASLTLLFFLTPFGIEGDGAVRFEVVSRFLSSGGLSRSPYSLIGPLASAPLWWLGNLHGAAQWWCARFNFFLFVLGLFAWYWALTPELDRRSVLRFLLVLTVASMFPHHNGRYYGEAFTAILVGVGLSVVVVKGRTWGWVLASIGTANTPASLVGLAVVAMWWTLRRREVRHLLPVAIAVALIMAEAWIRRGSPLGTGYEDSRGARTVLPYSGRPGFSYPFILGLLSILFSFGKGIFLFAPGLLVSRLTAARTARNLVSAWLLFLVGLVLVYSKWWGWNGGDFWGPRFLLFASIPAAYGLATWCLGPRRSNAVEAVGLTGLAWSVWIGASGLVFGFEGPEICTANHYALELLCWYTPEYSALFRPFIWPRALAPGEYVLLACFSVVGLYMIRTRVMLLIRSARPATP